MITAVETFIHIARWMRRRLATTMLVLAASVLPLILSALAFAQAPVSGVPDPARAGQERKFGAATNKSPAGFSSSENFLRSLQIDAEGFLGKQVFAGGEDIEINLFVKIVRDGHVNDIDIRRAKKFGVIFGEEFYGWNLLEPFEELFLKVADGDQFGADGKIVKDEPSGKSAGGFASHESAANNSDTHRLL